MVGCVIARGAEIVGEGWHRRFGGAHAEVEALKLAGERARGATMYVTLEPCCHHGKTPPCTPRDPGAGVARVVAAMTDPFPQVAGGGLAELRAAGVEVQSGVLEDEARKLNAPYLKLLSTGRPWIIAKWAMTLDGKIATATGDSRWISCQASREIVHQLRGRMDAIIVGRGTAAADDPLLDRPAAGPADGDAQSWSTRGHRCRSKANSFARRGKCRCLWLSARKQRGRLRAAARSGLRGARLRRRHAAGSLGKPARRTWASGG